MEVLTTSTGSQSLRIVPRKAASSPTLELTDKSKRTTSTVSVTSTVESEYTKLTGTFSLTEGVSYSFKVKDGLEVIYRGLIFCTNQTDLDKYFVNKDEYVSDDTYDNDYIFA